MIFTHVFKIKNYRVLVTVLIKQIKRILFVFKKATSVILETS